jgi:DNA-directed RNA polymerase specialized sigma24 family protein
LKQRDLKAFQTLVRDYAEDMTIFAFFILYDNEKTDKLVNDLLLKLFNNGFLKAALPLHTYLYKELKFECTTLLWEIEADKS